MLPMLVVMRLRFSLESFSNPHAVIQENFIIVLHKIHVFIKQYNAYDKSKSCFSFRFHSQISIKSMFSCLI